MATKKTKTNASARLVDPEDFVTDEDLEFEDFLDELGPENPTVSIFRVLRDGTREQIDKIPLSEIIADVYGWLRENCGTGKFQLYFRGADRRYRGAKTVAVGDRKPANGATPPAANGSNSHQEWMEKQLTLQQTFITGILGAMKGPDVGSLLSGLAQLAPKPAPAPDASAMLTAVATVFATLRGPQKDEDWLSRAKTIIELAKDLQPENNGGDTVWSVVKDVGKEVVHRLGEAKTVTAGNATITNTPVFRAPAPAAIEDTAGGADRALSTDVVSPVPAGNGAGAAAVQPINGAAVQLPQNAGDWLRVGLGYLKEKARLFKDPGIYVDLIFDNLEEPQWAAVVGAIRDGATFENLLQFDAEISQNDGLRNWFQRLYDALHSELFPSMDSTGGRGHEDNASGHARSRAAG